MGAKLYSIPLQGPGGLWIMPCPRADHLAEDIRAYHQAGVGSVVSMLAEDEARMLGLSQEAALCKAAGIGFESHPIVDFGLPDPADFAALTKHIAQGLQAGQNIAVHCRAGIGRSGMVTAGVLILQGESAAQAITRVSRARGVSIPDTVEQGKFLATFAERKIGMN